MRVDFTSPSIELADAIALSPDDIHKAVENPSQHFVDSEHKRLVCVHWQTAYRAIFVEASILSSLRQQGIISISHLRVRLAIKLGQVLPGGYLHREMSPQEVVARVADSFGVPLRFHVNSPYSLLYDGPCASTSPDFSSTRNVDSSFVFASFDSIGNAASLAWALAAPVYLEWLRQAEADLRNESQNNTEILAYRNVAVSESKPTIGDLTDCCGYHYHRYGDRDAGLLTFSYKVLEHYLGDDCLDQTIGPGPSPRKHRSARRFFRDPYAPENIGGDIRHQDRVARLAELVFNQQEVDGIERVIEDIRNGQAQAAFEELECGAILMRSAVPYRYFRPPDRQGRSAPDIEIRLMDGSSLYCEVKGKREATPPSADSLRQSLKRARKQLRGGEAGIVHIKVPEGWLIQDGIPEFVEEEVERLFSETQRIVAVVMGWQHYFRVPGTGAIASMVRHKVVRNDKTPLFTPFVEHVLQRIGSTAGASRWVSFPLLIDVISKMPQEMFLSVGLPLREADGSGRTEGPPGSS